MGRSAAQAGRDHPPSVHRVCINAHNATTGATNAADLHDIVALSAKNVKMNMGAVTSVKINTQAHRNLLAAALANPNPLQNDAVNKATEDSLKEMGAKHPGAFAALAKGLKGPDDDKVPPPTSDDRAA